MKSFYYERFVFASCHLPMMIDWYEAQLQAQTSAFFYGWTCHGSLKPWMAKVGDQSKVARNALNGQKLRIMGVVYEVQKPCLRGGNLPDLSLVGCLPWAKYRILSDFVNAPVNVTRNPAGVINYCATEPSSNALAPLQFFKDCARELQILGNKTRVIK